MSNQIEIIQERIILKRRLIELTMEEIAELDEQRRELKIKEMKGRADEAA